MKKDASSKVMPIAAKTTAKSECPLMTVAWRAICAAILLWGMPLPEKIGNFCPRTSGFMPSIVDMPVWMNSEGKSREKGFIGFPLTSR